MGGCRSVCWSAREPFFEGEKTARKKQKQHKKSFGFEGPLPFLIQKTLFMIFAQREEKTDWEGGGAEAKQKRMLFLGDLRLEREREYRGGTIAKNQNAQDFQWWIKESERELCFFIFHFTILLVLSGKKLVRAKRKRERMGEKQRGPAPLLLAKSEKRETVFFVNLTTLHRALPPFFSFLIRKKRRRRRRRRRCPSLVSLSLFLFSTCGVRAPFLFLFFYVCMGFVSLHLCRCVVCFL